MLDRFRTRQSAITFDVGSTGVRACQLSTRGSHLALRDLLRIDLAAPDTAGPEKAPDAPLSSVGPVPPAESLTEAAGACDAQRLARLVDQGSFSGRDVALVLSPPEIRFHTLRMPENVLLQPEERIRSALSFEVAREARCEPAELEVRHWPLPPGHSQGLNVMAVSLASRRAGEWYAAFAQRKLNLKRLDVSPCALVRLALQSWTPSPKDLWAVFECGFRQTVLTVVVGERPAYVRCLPVSTNQWTHRLADAFDLPYSEAEELKRTHGICIDSGEAAAPNPDLADVSADELPAVIFSVLRDSLDSLVREIDLCCSYVMRSYSDLNVSRLVLAGGGSNLRGLGDYLALHLGVPVGMVGGIAGDGRSDPQSEAGAALGGALLDLEAA